MFKAKKSLGQNFLKSGKIVEKIIDTADLKSGDIVLEVGPGKGLLTEKLLEKAKKVSAVEKDDRLIGYLQKKFAREIKTGKLELIHNDILDFSTNNLKPQYQIIANLPYYITGQFLRKFLSCDFPPSKMVVMLQKEVAQRITSNLGTRCLSLKKGGKESILSLSVKVYGEPKYIATVKAENFTPRPKVDSALLLIDNISKRFFKNINEENFFRLIRAGFSNKRKMLINNLSSKTSTRNLGIGYLSFSKEGLADIFEKLEIPLKIRAEDLSLQDWKGLYLELENIFKKQKNQKQFS
ncbi:MAG: ribosomal RNA small subunit methyltransferase A [Candidatus Pacebacteria bacterium]|nr:ribosomal RNA small subunit methyltransferase A [Candidatus Paceibacterota bacterium]